jgi:hypothetical protein
MAKRDYTKVNEIAANLTSYATYTDFLFGKVTLVGKNEEWSALARENGDDCDMYEVEHSGHTHCWSSASVAAAFVGVQ